MSKTNSFLFLMLGHPGSGKSFVAEWLAPHMQAVHLRSDDMRLKLFGKERLEFHKNWGYQRMVHSAMHYAACQVLYAGHSVVYDANHTTLRSRKPIQEVAEGLGITPVIVWVKAPLALSKQRVYDREAAGGMKIFEPEFVDRMAANLQPPSPHEAFVELDGTQAAKEQRDSFDRQLEVIQTGKIQYKVE